MSSLIGGPSSSLHEMTLSCKLSGLGATNRCDGTPRMHGCFCRNWSQVVGLGIIMMADERRGDTASSAREERAAPKPGGMDADRDVAEEGHIGQGGMRVDGGGSMGLTGFTGPSAVPANGETAFAALPPALSRRPVQPASAEGRATPALAAHHRGLRLRKAVLLALSHGRHAFPPCAWATTQQVTGDFTRRPMCGAPTPPRWSPLPEQHRSLVSPLRLNSRYIPSTCLTFLLAVRLLVDLSVFALCISITACFGIADTMLII